MSTEEEQREADLERREREVAAREAALDERLEAAKAILTAADARDATADTRDDAADKRETDLDRAQLLDPLGERAYGSDWPERRNAGLDREHAKEDRTASHADRVGLTEGQAESGSDQT